MPFRLRKSVAALCIAIAVFAVLVPIAALEAPVPILAPRWFLVPPPAATHLRSVNTHAGDEQLVAYHSLLPARAPPAA